MEDLRVKKTKRAIKESFISLVEEKGYNKISIKDICDRALINRNTFYLHYYDKLDLLNKICAEIFLTQKEKISMLRSRNGLADINEVKKIMHGILEVFYEEIEFYRILLLDNSMSGHVNNIVSELKKAIIKSFILDYKKFHVEIDYIFYGIMGVITQWIIKDNSSIDEIVDLVCNIAMADLIQYVVLKQN